ncbi:MAG: efflux RND transporter periplasmic adaptor subunit [Acidobacteriota bacterium]
MDRELDSHYRNRQRWRRLLISLLIIVLGVATFIYGPRWIKPSLSRTRIRTARVDIGSIEATLTTSGTVVPQFEQVISSPINSKVVKILKKPGALLTKGEAILEMDTSEALLTLTRLNQQIELKWNQQEKTKLELTNTLINLKSQWEIKNLEMKSALFNSTRDRELFQQGLLSESKYRQSETEAEKARIELKQLEDSRQHSEQVTKTTLAGLELELKNLLNEKAEAERQLSLATAKSDRNGVLTWVITEEGSTAQKGDILARIADLTSFRVEATLSDVHANRISVGMPVNVKVDDQYLTGTISNVLPTVKNGVITLLIELQEKSDTRLKANLRVDVLIVTARKERVLRVARGPFASSEGAYEVFVIRGNSALRTPVHLGISSFDHFEIVEGLLAGDEVIVSDMRDYLSLKEVLLK